MLVLLKGKTQIWRKHKKILIFIINRSSCDKPLHETLALSFFGEIKIRLCNNFCNKNDIVRHDFLCFLSNFWVWEPLSQPSLQTNSTPNSTLSRHGMTRNPTDEVDELIKELQEIRIHEDQVIQRIQRARERELWPWSRWWKTHIHADNAWGPSYGQPSAEIFDIGDRVRVHNAVKTRIGRTITEDDRASPHIGCRIQIGNGKND